MVASHPNSLSYPPLDGSLFLPELLEFNAQHNSDVTFYVYNKPGNDDLVSISHLDFYQACHRAAHQIRPNRAGADNEVVGIIANSDTLLFQTVFMGIIFAGLVPFPMSPRNSAAAVLHIMQKTKCRRLVTTHHSLSSLIDGIKAGIVSNGTETSQLQLDEIPALKGLYPALVTGSPDEDFLPYPPQASRSSQNDVLYYIHSSGSTGFPKPIPITNQSAIDWCATPCIADNIGVLTPIRVAAASAPPFHGAGVLTQLLLPIASLSSVSIYPPASFHDPSAAPIIPNSQNILESVLNTQSTALWAMPFFIERWAFDPNAIDILKTLEYVVYTGGPLASKAGNALVDAGVTLWPMYGCTEIGPISSLFRNGAERKLWDWVRFSPNTKTRWVPQDDGTYECQILITPTCRVSVENLPDVKGYATSDLFIKHPTIEGLWKISGRKDEVLMLSSGEKVVPAPMECLIGTNPYVNGAVIFGRGRSQVGILIEPRAGHEIDVDDEAQVSEFRNRVWPEIEEANKAGPAFSRIFKEMFLVTRREKPMLRAGKETVTKKAVIQLYEEEINALYDKVEGGRTGIDVPLPTNWTTEDVESWLMVHSASVNAGKAVDPDTDFFAQGFDSLSATFLRNRIIGSLRSALDRDVQASALRIDQNIVFLSPSIRQLARSVIHAVLHGNSPNSVDVKAEIESMIEKYSIGFSADSTRDASATLVNGRSRGNHVVILTGSTGGLGSYLLASLLQREDVSVVYAFNRLSRDDASIEQRQKSSFEDRGLDTSLLQSEKLMYIETDTSGDDLGLEKGLYQKIRTSVTIIIHNAWRLDFNLALSSFEPNVRGTRNLIDLALSSPYHPKPRFLFTSSISTAQSWDKAKGPFPEEVQYDAGIAEGLGYGASKYVCERVLVNSKLPASSFRIGQIAGGPPRGAWSKTDWLPIIVKSSVNLGVFPEAQGLLSWIPTYAVSNAILDVAFAEEEPPIAINLVHPRPVAWKTLMRPVADAIFERKITSVSLPFIPFSEWSEKVELSAKNPSEQNIQRIPAIKLLNYIRFISRSDIAIRASGEMRSDVGGFTSFATGVAQRVSLTVKELEPLSSVTATTWVDYWEAVGMFR
ncbi:putative aminoadipate reductase [Suillus clintonianus]|uniref:putative aminoadipate reductase n=1 Tax=Suillus clintonianus TaxID=1904413 RepID=UPI001B87CAAE|nr:putative aminoadipate reductase [Suillus clintonianus]KAG2133342.1 putative aminoadipate reductase [Suillus clintonianus]